MSYILLISKGEPEHSYNQIKTKPKFNSIKSAVLIIQDRPPTHTHAHSLLGSPGPMTLLQFQLWQPS